MGRRPRRGRLSWVLLAAAACALPAPGQSDEAARRAHVLPHLADGGGWQSLLLVTNAAQSASFCTVELYGLTADRFESADAVSASGSEATFRLDGHGDSLVWRTRNEMADGSGYATLDCNAPVTAQVVFQWIEEGDRPTGIATVFSSQTGRDFQFPVLTAAGTLGFAIANDTVYDAECDIVLQDPRRADLDDDTIEVRSKSNRAELLHKIVSIPDGFTGGSATVSCDRDVAMIGLHFELNPDESIITFNTLPPTLVDPSMPGTDAAAKPSHVLPHIADGGGWQSSLIVTNVASSASRCMLTLRGLAADRFQEADGVTISGSSATFDLDGPGAYRVWPTRNAPETASGYAILDCTAPVTAQVVFAWVGEGGRPTGMATVFSSQDGDYFQLPVLTPAGTVGFAIANDTADDADCRIELEDMQRTKLAEAELSVPSKTNLARLLNTVVPIPASFQGGAATVSCDRTVAAIGLHFELNADESIVTFNTLPPALLDAPVRTTPVGARGVLTTLFESTNGAGWTVNTNWGTAAPVGDWYGVEVDGQGQVTGLRMFRWVNDADGTPRKVGIGMTGPIPPELSSLTHLRVLDFDQNDLTGPIPVELAELTELRELRLWNNDLTGTIPPELGRLTHLTALDLDQNDLTGTIPPELGGLVQLEELWMRENALTGTIPPELGDLTKLVDLSLHGNRLTGPIPPEFGNLTRLERLWLHDNDLTGRIPEELGGLTNLELLRIEENNLSGTIPAELGQLSDLEILTLFENSLVGRIPPELGNLTGLEVLRLEDNRLTGAIPAELGNLANLEIMALSENRLTGSVPAEMGRLTGLRQLVLFDNMLTGSIPPGLGNLTDLEDLYLHRNRLSGTIPLELGNLTNLEELVLFENALTGAIPVELGRLTRLTDLLLSENRLTGPIPVELGNLRLLRFLWLHENGLAGPIPPEIGSLINLFQLRLHTNDLTGPIPPELARLFRLRELAFDGNDLAGAVPPELGGLVNLSSLSFSGNAQLTGELPSALTRLRRLDELLANATDLCAPSDDAFQTWLDGIWKRRVQPCGAEAVAAYLTQAVQSRRYPVPLVANEEALLRVFVTAPGAPAATIPPVRARFFLDDQETHVADIPAGTAAIPAEVNEGSLAASANATVPAEVIQPGLEIVVEIDPDGTLPSGVDIADRIPETGRLPIDVRAMPVFDLTMIPFIWRTQPDASIETLVNAMAADPEGHGLFKDTRTLLPIHDLAVTAHESVMVSTNDPHRLLAETGLIRLMEGGRGYYMGTMSAVVAGGGAAGVAWIEGATSFARPVASTIAHELGHNLGLRHAPCGRPDNPDPSFPQANGTIGAWGYDFRGNGRLVPPTHRDLMSYCQPQWIGDFGFTNAFRFRLQNETPGGGRSSQTAASGRSLLLWGGVDADGAPFLEPVFVVDAPASLPDAVGDYRISGATAAGAELFTLDFAMPVVGDGDGRSSFAFTVPVGPGWAEVLAGVTLTGPGGSVTLDGETDRPVTILRDPQSGQIRGILRDLPDEGLPGEAPAAPADANVEVLTSRGLPTPDDWQR